MRFSMEVLAAVRERVGPSFILGVRYVADELSPAGYDKTEGIAISQALKKSGLIDFLNVSRGPHRHRRRIDRQYSRSWAWQARHTWTQPGEVRAATRFPVFHATRIQDVATARHAVESGKVDMIGMTRAHMADPHIMRKIMEKREHDIRPCVGANYCLDRIYQGAMALCIHNPSTGREETLPHELPKAAAKKKDCGCRGRTGRAGSRARGGRARPRGYSIRSGVKAGGQILSDRSKPAAARNDGHRRLASGAMRSEGRQLPIQQLGR